MIAVAGSTSRSTRMRKLGGYGAALAVTPYLVIKLAWTFGILLPDARMGEPSWRAINATTALLALVGVLLGLAFSRPWGERLPAGLVLVPVWVGTGLLMPMVLLAPVLGPAAVATDQAAGATGTWAIEQLLVIVSLVGVGVGLPIAFAGYAKARWPEALGGPLDGGDAPGHTRQLQLPLAGIVAVGCVLLGATKLYWTLGGTVWLDPGRLAGRDLWWRGLTLSTGVWSLSGAWAVLVLTARRGAKRFLVPMTVSWVSSGMLFAYNLFSSLRADAQASPEQPMARVLATQAGIVLGLVMALVVLLVLHDRRRAELARREIATGSWPNPGFGRGDGGP